MAILVVALGVGCQPDAVRSTAQVAPVPVAPRATGSTRVVAPAPPATGSDEAEVRSPAPPATGSDEAEVSSPAPAASMAPAVSYLPPASNPDRIYCGTTECEVAREVCCFGGGIGRCLPKGQECDEAEQQRDCDEAADCGRGELCCEQFTGPSSPTALHCARGGWRGLCDLSWGSPELGGEMCMPGSPCKGTRSCAPETFEPGHPGYCRAPPSVRCGKETCSGSTPFCGFVSDEPEISACTDSTSLGMGCASPDDCSGYPCLQMTEESYLCGDLLDAGMNAIGALCKRVSDCPTLKHGSIAITQRPLGCRADPRLPSGVKKCVYPPLPPG